ncbi:MAG: N-acetyltransferase [Nocardioidaceae bacterium]
MQHDPIGDLITSRRIARHWPAHLLAFVLDDGSVAARAVSIPFNADRTGREALPDTGWDGAVQWALEDLLDEVAPTSACALEIAVADHHRGKGLSAAAIAALRDTAKRQGLRELVAPLRPPDKATEPTVPMSVFMNRTRPDGLPTDRWLRAHVRAGATLVGVAPRSMTVLGSIAEWREWTGLPLEDDGPIHVSGALAPVLINHQLDLGLYVEPNVWVRHLT